MGLKDKLSKPGKRKLVELEIDGEKVNVELREVNLATKAALQKAAGGLVKDAEGNDVPKDIGRFVASLVVAQTFDPETGKRVFSDAEVDTIADAGPHIDKLISECMAMAAPSAEELKGKSPATPG